MRFRSLIPSKRTRIAVLLAILLAAMLRRYPEYVYPGVLPQTNTERWFPARRVYDHAHFLSRFATWKYEEMLGGILDEEGADVRFEFVSTLPKGDSLESYALKRMRTLGVGKETDRRGLLFVYDVGKKRLRIEVGPNLEGVFPDGFVGYLMREHTASFFESPNPELGLRTTMFMVQNRLRSAALGRAYDPTPISFITDSVRLAAGGGASIRAGTGVDSRGFIGRAATPEEREQYSAQPTPELAFHRWLNWLRDGQKVVDVALFTPETRAYLRTLPMTRAYNDYILFTQYGQTYRVVERGARALLYFTSTPFVSPLYYRKTPAGWQVDIIADMMNSVEYNGFEWTYFVIRSDDDFSYAFADLMDDYGNGLYRVRDADNRRLPIHFRR